MSAATEPVRLCVVGAGNRGTSYASWALDHPDRAQVVAVAEPDPVRRQTMQRAHQVADDAVWSDWRELLHRPRVADAVIISTQDAMHHEPAIALAGLGYDIMLEKPMAPTLTECEEIVAATDAAGVVFAVCHVLLYTPYTRALMDVLESRRIGDVVSVRHLEPVGHTHQAHSFVRGHWRREDESNPMLMAKSCHDIDWLQHVVAASPSRVTSFGGLRHFRAENRPPEAADRCVACPLADTCIYSATTYYGDLFERGNTGWPLNTVLPEFTAEALDTALREGPYGRCVYACDNDVVDHQVVNLEYADQTTVAFTMTAFTEGGHRRTEIYGTHGEVRGDGRTIEVIDFGSGEHEVIDPTAHNQVGAATADGGHGGGDAGLMDAFTHAVATRDTRGLYSNGAASLASHRTVFAAEEARRESRVVSLQPA